MPDPNPILQSENPGKAALVAARASAKPEPRTWSLPPEPGPEVKAVRDRDGNIWRHSPECSAGCWGVTGGEHVSWLTLLRTRGPLTDATEDTQ